MLDTRMDRRTFQRFRELIYEKSGINLSEQKEALLCTRVGKRMRALGHTDFKEYYNFVRDDGDGEELVQLLDAISTNVTSFYREPVSFVFFREKIEKWWKAGQRRFRFWSAACSTGEEPYTILMEYMNSCASNAVDVRVLATDISTRALGLAKAGRYAEEKVRNIPRDSLSRYFDMELQNNEKYYTINPEIRQKVSFCRMNLSTPPFQMRGPFDIVFCRNVMIYFDLPVRTRLIAEIERLLKPGGYLILGQSEGLTGVDKNLMSVKPAIYVKS